MWVKVRPIAQPDVVITVADERASKTGILFDKFHILRHLGKALGQIRKSDYAWLAVKGRCDITCQKDALPLYRDDASLVDRNAMKIVMAANTRINTAWLPR